MATIGTCEVIFKGEDSIFCTDETKAREVIQRRFPDASFDAETDHSLDCEVVYFRAEVNGDVAGQLIRWKSA